MNINDFKKLQLTQMEIMDEVHRVCTENNIRYYIIGGTALGAKRHTGYIPWDVDIDIAMPRSDYEKFADIAAQKLSERFIYRDYLNTKAFSHPHALVCIKDTFLSYKFSKFNPKEENLGIYLDIFPLDKAPGDKELQIQQANKIRKLRNLKERKQAYKYDGSKIKAFFKDFISLLIFWTSIDKLNADFDKYCKKYEDIDSEFLCSMSSHYRYEKQCMPADIYGTPTLVKFEDREYFAPEKLEEYLTRIFGDYMKLPPENERTANLSVFDTVKFDRT